MGKSKRKLNDLSILSTFVLLAVVFLLLAILLVEVERTLLTNAQRDIPFSIQMWSRDLILKRYGEINRYICFQNMTGE